MTLAREMKARFSILEGNRHYTDTTYTWYDDDSVIISVVKGDDDWDCYNGADSVEKTAETTFDKLPENIRQELTTDFNERTVKNQSA